MLLSNLLTQKQLGLENVRGEDGDAVWKLTAGIPTLFEGDNAGWGRKSPFSRIFPQNIVPVFFCASRVSLRILKTAAM